MNVYLGGEHLVALVGAYHINSTLGKSHDVAKGIGIEIHSHHRILAGVAHIESSRHESSARVHLHVMGHFFKLNFKSCDFFQ